MTMVRTPMGVRYQYHGGRHRPRAGDHADQQGQYQNENLRQSLTYMAPMFRLYANVLGNGHWFEGIITNLLPPSLPQQNTTRLPVKQKQFDNGTNSASGR